MLATWLAIYVSVLFPVPVESKTRLLRNLLIDYCEFAINASSGKTMYKVGLRNARNSLCRLQYTQFRLSTADAAKVAEIAGKVTACGRKNCSLHL